MSDSIAVSQLAAKRTRRLQHGIASAAPNASLRTNRSLTGRTALKVKDVDDGGTGGTALGLQVTPTRRGTDRKTLADRDFSQVKASIVRAREAASPNPGPSGKHRPEAHNQTSNQAQRVTGYSGVSPQARASNQQQHHPQQHQQSQLKAQIAATARLSGTKGLKGRLFSSKLSAGNLSRAVTPLKATAPTAVTPTARAGMKAPATPLASNDPSAPEDVEQSPQPGPSAKAVSQTKPQSGGPKTPQPGDGQGIIRGSTIRHRQTNIAVRKIPTIGTSPVSTARSRNPYIGDKTKWTSHKSSNQVQSSSHFASLAKGRDPKAMAHENSKQSQAVAFPSQRQSRTPQEEAASGPNQPNTGVTSGSYPAANETHNTVDHASSTKQHPSTAPSSALEGRMQVDAPAQDKDAGNAARALSQKESSAGGTSQSQSTAAKTGGNATSSTTPKQSVTSTSAFSAESTSQLSRALKPTVSAIQAVRTGAGAPNANITMDPNRLSLLAKPKVDPKRLNITDEGYVAGQGLAQKASGPDTAASTPKPITPKVVASSVERLALLAKPKYTRRLSAAAKQMSASASAPILPGSTDPSSQPTQAVEEQSVQTVPHSQYSNTTSRHEAHPIGQGQNIASSNAHHSSQSQHGIVPATGSVPRDGAHVSDSQPEPLNNLRQVKGSTAHVQHSNSSTTTRTAIDSRALDTVNANGATGQTKSYSKVVAASGHSSLSGRLVGHSGDAPKGGRIQGDRQRVVTHHANGSITHATMGPQKTNSTISGNKAGLRDGSSKTVGIVTTITKSKGSAFSHTAASRGNTKSIRRSPPHSVSAPAEPDSPLAQSELSRSDAQWSASRRPKERSGTAIKHTQSKVRSSSHITAGGLYRVPRDSISSMMSDDESVGHSVTGHGDKRVRFCIDGRVSRPQLIRDQYKQQVKPARARAKSPDRDLKTPPKMARKTRDSDDSLGSITAMDMLDDNDSEMGSFAGSVGSASSAIGGARPPSRDRDRPRIGSEAFMPKWVQRLSNPGATGGPFAQRTMKPNPTDNQGTPEAPLETPEPEHRPEQPAVVETVSSVESYYMHRANKTSKVSDQSPHPRFVRAHLCSCFLVPGPFHRRHKTCRYPV